MSNGLNDNIATMSRVENPVVANTKFIKLAEVVVQVIRCDAMEVFLKPTYFGEDSFSYNFIKFPDIFESVITPLSGYHIA